MLKQGTFWGDWGDLAASDIDSASQTRPEWLRYVLPEEGLCMRYPMFLGCMGEAGALGT